MQQLDLGSGATPREWPGYQAVGVDVVDYGNNKVRVADLALEPIPYDDDTFDLVTAYDFFEHIPPVLYLTDVSMDGIEPLVEHYKRNCMIELFNDVYRVLKNGGELFFALPLAGTTEYYRDPTHVYPWVEQSLHYFSGDYFGHHDDYGHTSKFELVEKQVIDGWRLQARLRAIKPCQPPYEVGAVV